MNKKKHFLISLILLSSTITVNAQIYGTIEGSSGNNNVGIGSTSSTQKLTVDTRQTSPNSGVPANVGTNQNGIMRLQVDGNSWGETLDFGMNILPSYAWLQATNRGNLSVNYNLSLNPNGGNIGIGVTTPASRLHIGCNNNEGILIGNYNDRLGWDGNGNQPGYSISFAGYRDVVSNFTGAKISALRTNYCCDALAQGMELAFFVSQLAQAGGDANLNEAMRIKSNGSIGIGTSNPDSRFKLDVLGTIRAREIKVDLNGADFVFENNYKLMPLNELDKFIKERKHLPEIASAKEMKENGTDLGNLNSKLLQKIEELTLYTIEQNKKLKEQNDRIEQQNQEFKILKEKVKKMELSSNKR